MPSTTTTTTTTAVPFEESLSVSDECPGIGALETDAAITFVRDGRIWSVAEPGGTERCLAEYTGYPWLRWGGAADRLLAGRRSVLLESGPVDVLAGRLEALGWSRPTGKALLARTTESAVTKLSAIEAAPAW